MRVFYVALKVSITFLFVTLLLGNVIICRHKTYKWPYPYVLCMLPSHDPQERARLKREAVCSSRKFKYIGAILLVVCRLQKTVEIIPV